MRRESAFAEAKPPIAVGDVVQRSAPPAIITSASPYAIKRPASPILCVPVAQAVTIAKFGPFKPYLIDKLPEIILIIFPGTKKGEIRRGPPFS